MSTHPQQLKKIMEYFKLIQFLNPQTFASACEYLGHYDQNLESWETNSISSGLTPALGLGINPWRSGIQGSSQILMVLPSSTIIQATLEKMCFTPSKLFQIEEELPWERWNSQLCLILYLALRTLTRRQFFPEKIHGASFNRRAWLNSHDFLKPKPLSFKGLQREDQEIGV